MPLQAQAPIIDDRTYDDIVAEIRTRAARYAPEWTDQNDNDPGMMLAQLFAWMTELLIYRLGLTPQANYIKFLELLGIDLTPAQSATTEITFPLLQSAPATVIVPTATQVSATPAGGGTPVVFETQQALIALAAQLTTVLSYDGYTYTNWSIANTAAQSSYPPFGQTPRVGSALLLGFSYSSAFPAIDLNLSVMAMPAASQVSYVSCDLAPTALYPSAVLQWEYWAGNSWVKLTLLKDETLAFTRTGHIVLRYAPTANSAMSQSGMGPINAPQYWIRATLTQSQYENPPELSAILTNTIQAAQAQTVVSEVLGGSSGLPNQTFTLQNTPVLAGSLDLEINESPNPTILTPWLEVSDFYSSGPNDRVYVLDRTSGTIRFSDGANGMIPVANANNQNASIIAVQYQFGGGSVGNLPVNSLTTMLTSVDGVDVSKVTNLIPAVGGQDEETLAQAKLRAPLALQYQCRAVTPTDYEALAKQAANIQRAKALPLFHPDFPTVQVPGVISVIVVPGINQQTQGQTTPTALPAPVPMPSDGTLQTVCAYLNQRRTLTTELYVLKPTYQPVAISAQVAATADADLATVTADVTQMLTQYLDPLIGGDDGQGWPFGGTIYFSRLYNVVFNVDGVQSVDQLVITLGKVDQPQATNVPIPTNALITLTGLNLQVDYQYGQ